MEQGGLVPQAPRLNLIPPLNLLHPASLFPDQILPARLPPVLLRILPLLGTFETTDLAGNPISQELFTQSDLTMVNIWATYCRPCLQEMPYLAELSDEYQDKMQIVGIISDVTEPEDETAALIIDQTGADYTHLLISQDLYDNYLSQVQVVPTTIFLDREGNQVGKVYAGAHDKAGWKKSLMKCWRR